VTPKIRFLWQGACLLPLLAVTIFVTANGVNVPLMDQWALPELFRKVALGTVSFQDWFAQHNEHRIVFPKLIFTALAFSTHWDTRVEMYISILISALSFALIYKISAQQTEKQSLRFWLMTLFTSVAIFSLIQAENWLWGFQLAWFLIDLCLIFCIFCLSSGWPSIWLKLSLAALSCLIASFSSAHGLMTWLVVMPSLLTLTTTSNDTKPKISIILGWLALFFSSCLIYFNGYQKPSAHPSLFYFLQHLDVGLTYFFSLLGSSLFYASNISAILGLLIFINFLGFLIRYLRQLRSHFSSQLAPWISLGLFSIAFALITTIGRSGFGIEQAYASRYTTVSILLIIALIQMWRISADAVRRTRATALIGAGILAVLVTLASVNQATTAHTWSTDRKWAKSCLEIMPVIDHGLDRCLQILFPDLQFLKSQAQALNQIGFRHDPNDLTSLMFIATPTQPYGYLDIPNPAKAISVIKRTCLNCAPDITVSGWAILPDEQKPASLVLFSQGSDHQLPTATFLSSTAVTLASPDVAKALRSPQYAQARWSSTLPINQLPLGHTVMKAWAYDSKGKKFVKLGAAKLRVEE
jgi:hypothetical protein